MAKVTASTTNPPPSASVRTCRSGYLVDSPSSPSSSRSVIGQPVESFSNMVGTDRIIKEACKIGGAVAPSFQQLLL